MKYFRINYDRLKNLEQINFYKIIIIIVINLIILLIVACNLSVYHKISFYGIYNDNILIIKINNKLSDIIKNNQYIKFNNKKTKYEIDTLNGFGEYEIIDNEIYQIINLKVDTKFNNNEVGLVELYYNKQKIIKYIFESFK